MSELGKDFLRILKEKVNIVEVAESYITLEKRGSGSYWACCPFHHEKTPSFCVNEPRQFYHCFGCGESGDVIKFVSQMESCDFMDSVKLLAERAKLEVPELSGADSQKTTELKRKRDAVLKILNESAHFYLNNLNSGNADEHIEYILSRKIPSSAVRSFGLGASLNFTDLPKYLISKGYSRQDIVDSGVVNDVDGRMTDAMGGRLVFPIINSYGEVIAFGGRALKKVASRKYVNTRDTLVFTKRNNLYNINLLKKLKQTQAVKAAIMVEGYMDVISLYSSGFKNVVASMGTSLTQDQARLIKRYTDTVLISYDGDSAGQSANLRGLDILKDEGINVKVVPLPEELDPDDVIKRFGNEGYQKCLDAAMPLIDYKIKILEKGYDLTKTEDKRKFAAEAIKVVRTADSEVEKEELLKSLRDKTGITFEALRRDMQSSGGEKKAAAQEKPPERKDTADTVKKASRFVIASILFEADYAKGTDVSGVPFADEAHSMVARYIARVKLYEEDMHLSELFELFKENTPEYAELERILDYSEGGLKGEVGQKYFNDCIRLLKINDVEAKIAQEKARLSATDSPEEKSEAMKNIMALNKLRQQIK